MQTSVQLSENSGGNPPAASASGFSHPWLPDQGDGAYCNPVLYADYSDPDVIRVGNDFYLVASSFNCTPGLPILHSQDLVNWTIIGHALKNVPGARYHQVQPGCGVWAPAMRYHQGKFWIFYPTPDEGIFLVTAAHPAGPWSEPHCLQEGRGLIDPCPLWDDDGHAYLVHAYAGSRAGIKHRLRVCPMAPDGSKLLGPGEIVFHLPEKHHTIEGPKFLKQGGWYYILAPAGGVEHGWQVALRSRHIYGPYEDKIVLSQGRSHVNGPHQGALVDTPVGDWWFLHFQDVGLFGRIVHLQPVQWRDGWPLIGREGEPVSRHAKPLAIRGQQPFAPQTSDEFAHGQLGLQWQWHANHQENWYSLAARPGWLRLYPQLAQPALNVQPNLLLQKFPARDFSVETLVKFLPAQSGEEAGLAIIGDTYAALCLSYAGNVNRILFRTGDTQKCLAETTSSEFILRVRVRADGQCFFSYAENGDAPVYLPEPFQATKGKWIGAKVGIYCNKQIANAPAGSADFDYFRF